MTTKWDEFVREEAQKHVEPGEEILGMGVWREMRGLGRETPYYAVITSKQLLLLETKRAWFCKGLWAFITVMVRGAHVFARKVKSVRKFSHAEFGNVKGSQTTFVRRDAPDTKGSIEWKLELRGTPTRFLEYDTDPSFSGRTVSTALQALPASTGG